MYGLLFLRGVGEKEPGEKRSTIKRSHVVHCQYNQGIGGRSDFQIRGNAQGYVLEGHGWQ